MPDHRAALEGLLELVTSGLANDNPLPPHHSIAVDVLADALVKETAPSPAAAFLAAKYVLAWHAREMADLLVTRKTPGSVDPRYWAATQLREYAGQLDGQPSA